MLNFLCLSSSSSGNCALFSDGTTHILIDAGISARRINLSLLTVGLSLKDISAVFVTHSHSDHVSGLPTVMTRSDAALYCSKEAADGFLERFGFPDARTPSFLPGEHIQVGGLTVSSVRTPHDSPGSVAYTVSANGFTMAVATDMGHLDPAVKHAVCGADMMLIEANYDPCTLKNGRYPQFLKRRILGEYGHLSNENAGVLAASAVLSGTREICLGHLSRENNTPELAYAAVASAITKTGAVIGRDVNLRVADRDMASCRCELKCPE